MSMNGWWEEMFELVAWQAVQLGWESLEDADHHVDLIVRATGARAGMRVLDVPCGTGRIAKRLVERGLDVVGVDITDRFLDEARAAGLVVERADMRELPFEDTFDVAICMWGSFGYFDDDGNLAQARAACKALKPGGRYLIDTLCAEAILPSFRERDWFEAEGTFVLEHRAYVVGTGRVETRWTFLRGADRQEQMTSIRLYTLHELTDLLREAGFSAFTAFDDELADFALGSRRLWLVATR
jgi:SAM-dependent methyltransferase